MGRAAGPVLATAAGMLAAWAEVLLPAGEAPVPLVVVDPGLAVGCAAATVPWTVWVALWAMAVTAGTGADEGAVWGAGPVLAAGAGVLAAGALVAEAAGALAAEAGALAAGAAGALAAGALAAGVLGAGALAGEVLAGGVLWVEVLVPAEAAVPLAPACPDGAGWLVGCDPPVDPWAALPAAAVEEATDDTAEEADDATGDTTSPAA